jgi:AbrB family looped-hinge helix DNA binding protein
MHVKVSKKGQIVIPKKIRDKTGIQEGSVLKIRLEGKKIIIETLVKPPKEIFVSAGDEITEPLIAEAKKSSDMAKKLLEALGIATDNS